MKNELISLEYLEPTDNYLEEERKEGRYTFYTYVLTGCIIALSGLYVFNGEVSNYMYENHIEKAIIIDKKVDVIYTAIKDYLSRTR